jgi:DHA2 family multidrug resistance protein
VAPIAAGDRYTEAMSIAYETAAEVSNLRRYLILATVSLATMLYAMTITIANVVLPQMRGTFSASPDQIAWVVTFNLVATAIVTPISGWLSARFGRRRVMLVGAMGFTAATIMCGFADSLETIVLFRIAQGALGAPLVPISQATLLDTFPRRKHSLVTALWGMGVVMGPIIGPTVGGAIAEEFNWRWAFYFIVPFSLLTILGIFAFIRDREQGAPVPKLDWTGFLALAIALGALQLMFDRGERQSWFESPEIIVEAAVGIGAVYIFLTHIMTSEKPFISPSLFLDRNYSLGLTLAFLFGMLNFAPMVLLPTMLQDLRGYPDSVIGLLLATRSVGNFASFLIVVKLSNFDPRLSLTVGFVSQALAGYAMSQFDINMTFWDIAWTSSLQGFGIGMTWVPLTLIMFATIKPEQLDQASAVFHMLRNFAASLFISICVAVVVRSTYINTLSLFEFISLFNKALVFPNVTGPFNIDDPNSLALTGSEIRRQAAMIGYLNAFKLFTIMSVIPIPLIWFARRHRPGA